MAGATLQQVADRLGYKSRQAVWKATTSLLERQERKASAEWQAFHLARLERLLLAVWHDALDGDDRAGQQALRIVQEIGRTTGASGPMRVEASGSGPAMEPHPVKRTPHDLAMATAISPAERARSGGPRLPSAQDA